ncbi:pseudouridine synthase [Sagittula stellata]|uniref:Pseudouridine synthase n=1 Tax=Sagittula stellata (strain ATCC 700073 / DSM 11524 / E-37) TaxID=388399 RepID=A3K8I4_SAGS3|nr:pseudouridine synthase [Sagittula stellata]EBA06422.1 RNA pseudouridylate synthase family protein [Sagittula stellata E-37]
MDNKTPPGDRIAKVIARAGRASRREAERMIAEGRVAVNGTVIDSPALNVTDKDRITVDDTPLDGPEEARLWLYHKSTGLVTTTKDEQGRPTIYDDLPDDLPRVMSVGRLDLNSEGLLLLTNDGGLKRRLELPSTGWLRRYRVRINGRPTDPMLQPLRDGLTVDGQTFQPMIVSLDRQQGANAWLTVGLREGKNREIRRAMADLGLSVNRLIRISYGPFQLGQMKPGEVQEVRRKILRDQLGLGLDAEPEAEAKPKPGLQPRTRKSRAAPTSAKPVPARSGAGGGKSVTGGPARKSTSPGAKPAGKSGPKPGGRAGPAKGKPTRSAPSRPGAGHGPSKPRRG